MHDLFLTAWHANAQLTQGLACKALSVDSEFPDFIKISFDVVMLDTAKPGLCYRSESQAIWVDALDFYPVCPLTCLIDDYND